MGVLELYHIFLKKNFLFKLLINLFFIYKKIYYLKIKEEYIKYIF
jgi:hypothetical protein